VDGEKLLGLFGLLMIAVAGLMLWRPAGGEAAEVRLDIQSAAKLLPPLAAAGLAVGFVSGFFGIGGGFLIVPGLVGATAMPLLNAIGSSLVSVATFGATTAISYAASGLVDWEIAGLFVLGGALGAAGGTWLAGKLAPRKKLLNRVFAGVVAAAGIYVAARGFAAVA
jgi:hypothetical protein